MGEKVGMKAEGNGTHQTSKNVMSLRDEFDYVRKTAPLVFTRNFWTMERIRYVKLESLLAVIICFAQVCKRFW